MARCAALQQAGWAVARPSLPPPTAARRRMAAWQPEQQRAAVAAQAARKRRSSGSSGSSSDGAGAAEAAAAQEELRAHLQQQGNGEAAEQLLDSLSAAVTAAETDPAAIAAAQQRLRAYLQQQDGISQADAAGLASRLSAKLGAAAAQLVPAPLQFFVARGMQPVKAARLAAHMCESGFAASYIRQWPKWQPVFEANWQLADSHLAAYQQRCKEKQQQPMKSSKSMAAMLSTMPSRYQLLKVRDLASRLAALQRGQLGLAEAEVGQLIAAGMSLGGSKETRAAAIQWLSSFAGSSDAAIGMLRAAPSLLNFSAATLDGQVAALQAAWAGVLQPDQLQQLVQRSPNVLTCKAERFGPTSDVLRSWFAQPAEVHAVLREAPQLFTVCDTSLKASEQWLSGAPLSLSRQEVLALLQAAPQAFAMNLAEQLTQHKLAFLTQVGSVPLTRALSKTHLNYLKSGLTALAGRYFLLTEHGVPLPLHKDGGIGLTYSTLGQSRLLRLMRRHDSQQRLPADDDEALDYIDRWLKDWPKTESGRLWAEPPPADAK